MNLVWENQEVIIFYTEMYYNQNVFQEKYHQQQLDVHRVFCTIKKHLREKQINFSIFFLQRFFCRIKSSNTPSRFRGFCFRWLIFTVLVKGFGAARLKLGQNFRRSKLNSAKIHSCNLYPVCQRDFKNKRLSELYQRLFIFACCSFQLNDF